MIIERLTEDVLKDEYFKSLYLKASKLGAMQLFSEKTSKFEFSEKDLCDILRFADILSNSNRPSARNISYKIIATLNASHKANAYYKTFAHSVLAKLGNFPGLRYLIEIDNNNSELPFDREAEKAAKEFRQAVPNTDDLIFTDAQFKLYTQISNSKCFSFSGPTSMGKSFIIKSFIRKAISNSPPEHIAIMVPTRALINQFSIDLNRELKATLERYNYKVVTNSNVTELPTKDQHLYVFVLTPERLLSYLAQRNCQPLGYLFVDEAHKIAAEKDPRSITAYTAISKVLRKNPNLNLYFASPNVANPAVFLHLFNKDASQSFRTTESPVCQNLFFVDMTIKKVTHFLDDGTYDFTPHNVQQSDNTYAVLRHLGSGDNNIIYCSSRTAAVERAWEFCKELSDETFEPCVAVKRTITQIRTYIHKDYYLADFLSKGVSYHFSTLPQIIRTKIEQLFKESAINYVFCTSTLLEGVNLPAKNVFILKDRNGPHNFKPIDFWNLAGRAGRLVSDLSGNIFCIKESQTDWKHMDLLDRNKEITLKPAIENWIDKKLNIIEEMIKESGSVKKETAAIRKILAYIANIISIDALEDKRTDYKSDIIKRFIETNREAIIEIAKQKNAAVNVPTTVLSANQSIKISIQDRIFNELKGSARRPSSIMLPTRIDFETCREWLHKFYRMFHWKDLEERIKSEKQLDYFAMLMNQWINGIPLNSIINQSINFYHDNHKSILAGYKDSKPNYESFQKNNRLHVNILIGNIIEDIERVLRFMFEKYFNNYYSMLIELLGEENAGVNWATFLEYGTRDSVIIALQNYGLSRHSANYLATKHKNCLVTEGDKLLGIDIPKLKANLLLQDIEHDEISSILF